MKVIFILSLLFATGAAADYDFFYMVMQWPKSFCGSPKIQCPRPAKKYFTIHGLWPQKYNEPASKQPKYCGGPDLKQKDLMDPTNSLLPVLNKYWLNETGSSVKENFVFWAYEWKKHGSCSFGDHTILQYFETAAHFAVGHDVLKVLNKAGINPGPGSSAKVVDFKMAILKEWGFEPGIGCNRNTAGALQLYERYFCLDKSGHLTKCVNGGDKGCGINGQVSFPF